MAELFTNSVDVLEEHDCIKVNDTLIGCYEFSFRVK